MSLAEDYRPVTLEQLVGQTEAVATARKLMERGLGGRALWISGPSGTGKTTLARILAATIADLWCIVDLDAGQLTADALREIEGQQRLYGWGKGGRAWIVNEAHGLRADVIRRLLVLLESIPDHVLWVFTTTSAGQDKLFDCRLDAGPLLSRCALIELRPDLRALASYCKDVASREGLDGKPVEDYVGLLERHACNVRAALQAIETGAMRATT